MLLWRNTSELAQYKIIELKASITLFHVNSWLKEKVLLTLLESDSKKKIQEAERDYRSKLPQCNLSAYAHLQANIS